MTRGGEGARRPWPAFAFALTSLMMLAGCATFGGNVRGSFSCAAPDGICAPSSTIDDRALALISGDASDGEVAPASNSARPASERGKRTALQQPARIVAADPGRTREKVLRIVFQSYIDERGRLHEASAVHAVVARGQWQQTALLQTAAPVSRAAEAGNGSQETLADAVDRVDPPAGDVAQADPNAPDPAAVAAARARKPDAVEAIKADVAARLTPRAGRARSAKTGEAPDHPPSAAASPAPPPPTEQKAGDGRATGAAVRRDKAPETSSADRAVQRVKADPRYGQAATGAVQSARDAAGQVGNLPTPPAVPGSTVKAASFPAAVREDQ